MNKVIMIFFNLMVLLLAGTTLSDANVTDQEAEDALNELGKLLDDKQEVKDSLAEIKKEIGKGPTVAARLLGVTKSLSLAVPKLKSDDSAEVAQGVLNVVAGIAEFFPGGMFIAPLASLVSSIIGLLSSTKVDNTIRDVVRDVVRETSDQELEGKAAASRAELTAAMNYLLTKHTQKLDSEDVTRMIVQIKVTTGAGILELLATRIRYRSKATTAEEARRGLKFCLLYAQIASFRDMIINDLIIQIRRAGDEDEAIGYQNVVSDFINSYRKTLRFLNHPEPSQAGVVHLFRPTDQSAVTAYIENFMKMAKVEEPTPWLASRYSLISVKWPKYHAFLHTSGYVRLAQGLVPSDSQISFTQRKDGYWELKQEGKWLTIDTDYPDHVGTKSSEPGDDDHRSHFIIVKYPDTDIITISCRKWPEKFWKGEGGTYYVRIRDGNTGTDVQFRAKLCTKPENWPKNYHTPGYRCYNLP